MKPVAFILEASSLSGGVRVCYEYATRLKQRGHSVHIWSLGEPPKWFDIGDVHWMQFTSYDDMIKFMKKDGKGFNKVATWWRTAEVLALDEGSKERGESFYLVQDVESSYYYRPFEREQVARTYEYNFFHFTPNLWVTSLLPMPCVGQAYDARVFHKMKYVYPSDRVVLAVLRRQALKGFSQLGEFSRRLGALDSKAELWTLGIDTGTRLSGVHSAHFVGLSDSEVARKYCEAKCFVCQSIHEGFGLTLLEAMASATPVVLFENEGSLVFCKHGENSMIAPKGDVITLANYVMEVMKDKKLHQRLTEGGLETARKFSDWDSVIDKLELVLDKKAEQV